MATNRFASSIMTHDERQRLVKLDNHLVVGAERPDPLDEHLQGTTLSVNGASVHSCPSDRS